MNQRSQKADVTEANQPSADSRGQSARQRCRVRCPQPTTALPDGDAAAAETPSAACDAPSHPAPVAYRLPPALLHKLHAAACAVLCGGTQELARSLSARGGERIQGAAAPQHAHADAGGARHLGLTWCSRPPPCVPTSAAASVATVRSSSAESVRCTKSGDMPINRTERLDDPHSGRQPSVFTNGIPVNNSL